MQETTKVRPASLRTVVRAVAGFSSALLVAASLVMIVGSLGHHGHAPDREVLDGWILLMAGLGCLVLRTCLSTASDEPGRGPSAPVSSDRSKR